MCTRILRVAYRANAEPAVLLPFDDDASADARIVELRALETVESVTEFARTKKHRRATVWEVIE